MLCKNVRIHHEYEGGIRKSVPRIIVWHYEACRVMTKGNQGGQIFRSHPHTNNEFFFLLTINTTFYVIKGSQKFVNMLKYNIT